MELVLVHHHGIVFLVNQTLFIIPHKKSVSNLVPLTLISLIIKLRLVMNVMEIVPLVNSQLMCVPLAEWDSSLTELVELNVRKVHILIVFVKLAHLVMLIVPHVQVH